MTDTGDPNHLLLEGRGPRMENDIHENYVYDELKVQCIEDHFIKARNKKNFWEYSYQSRQTFNLKDTINNVPYKQ